ncbi:MAG: rod shape-determining protein RodA [Bacteroidia bacterium]|jgi:rod shape determining protein RodA|nr:rod shape-determining protein RodA [Bacteroidia bacterium]MCC6768493.1 rod shape-determining protein RodA [Bacteroidia bacterium]
MANRNSEAVFQNIDWFMVVIYLLLVTMGWLNIYAAVYNDDHTSIFDTSQSYGMQLVWILSSFFLAFVILVIDGEFFPTFAYILYGIFVLLLIVVLFAGVDVRGSKSWIEVGTFRIQPAELAKFATNLALAKYLSNVNIKIEKTGTKLIAASIFMIPAAIIIMQSETGAALVYAGFILVLYREGLSGIFLILGAAGVVLFITTLLVDKAILSIILGAIAVFAFLFIRIRIRNILAVAGILLLSLVAVNGVDYAFNNVLESHQRKRINVLIGKEIDPKGAGYNVNQSMIAIGSGGLAGKGYLNGTQTKNNFVPEQSTDFIFCTVGEEWGFIGSTVVLGLFLLLILRIIFMAERQRSAFSRIYGYGLASILFVHLAINVGMTIGLAPVVGIPLPFFSYGGSSLWSFTILTFIFIRLDAYRFQILR